MAEKSESHFRRRLIEIAEFCLADSLHNCREVGANILSHRVFENKTLFTRTSLVHADDVNQKCWNKLRVGLERRRNYSGKNALNPLIPLHQPALEIVGLVGPLNPPKVRIISELSWFGWFSGKSGYE